MHQLVLITSGERDDDVSYEEVMQRRTQTGQWSVSVLRCLSAARHVNVIHPADECITSFSASADSTSLASDAVTA